MIRTLADPWLAQNAGRKYPLADDVDTGIPDNAILDFRCTVRGVGTSEVPVARIYYIGSRNDPDHGFIKYADVEVLDGTDLVRLGTLRFEIPRSRVPDTGAHYTAVAENGNIWGILTVQYAFTRVPYGQFDAVFAKTTVVTDSLGVDSLQGLPAAAYDEDNQHRISGKANVPLQGEITLDLGANVDPYLYGNQLRLEITKGGGRGEWCQAQETDQNCSNVLFTVNGERPGSDGDIRIVGEGGVTVTPKPAENALEISIEKPASDVMTKDCTATC